MLTQRLQDKQGQPHLFLVPVKPQHPTHWYKWVHPVPRRKRGCSGSTFGLFNPGCLFQGFHQAGFHLPSQRPPRLQERGRRVGRLGSSKWRQAGWARDKESPGPGRLRFPPHLLPREAARLGSLGAPSGPGRARGVSGSPAGAKGAREAGRQEKENLARPEREEVRQQKRDKRAAAAAALPPLCAFLFLSLPAPG